VSNQTVGGARSRAIAFLLSWARPLAVALAGCLAASCAAEESEEATASVIDEAHAIRLFAGIPQHAGVLGNLDAPVTLVELSDLRCSHCRDFAQITLPVLVDRYVRTGQLRVVFGVLPILGEASVQAARMAVAAAFQDRLFEFAEAFFAHASGPITDDLLRRIASEVPGLDVDKAMAMRDSKEVTDVLAETRRIADHYGVQGTPSFLLGKAGGDITLVHGVWPNRPETLTGAIDALIPAPSAPQRKR
jgi:protein-disulfide isomerase